MDSERVLALDLGSKRVGLAISSPLGNEPFPLPFLPFKNAAQLIADLRKIAGEKGVRRIVVGLPVSLNETLGEQARRCKNLSKKIAAELKIPVELFDESFTTKEAEEILIGELNLSRQKRQKLKDSLAACLLLRSYLQSGKNS